MFDICLDTTMTLPQLALLSASGGCLHVSSYQVVTLTNSKEHHKNGYCITELLINIL
jgi:hypothetical protein